MVKITVQMGNVSREMENIEKNKMKILKLKSTIYEVKILLDGFSKSLETAD